MGEYAVIEHIGSGAFGAVHKVKKGTAGQSFYAMKEVGTTGLNIYVIKQCKWPTIPQSLYFKRIF